MSKTLLTFTIDRSVGDVPSLVEAAVNSGHPTVLVSHLPVGCSVPVLENHHLHLVRLLCTWNQYAKCFVASSRCMHSFQKFRSVTRKVVSISLSYRG